MIDLYRLAIWPLHNFRFAASTMLMQRARTSSQETLLTAAAITLTQHTERQSDSLSLIFLALFASFDDLCNVRR